MRPGHSGGISNNPAQLALPLRELIPNRWMPHGSDVLPRGHKLATGAIQRGRAAFLFPCLSR